MESEFGGLLLITLLAVAVPILASLIGLSLTRLGLARNPLLMGLILSTTSLGIVVPILKERGMTNSSFGQLLLTAALIIAASAIALDIGMITPATNSAVILVAIVSCTFSPLLFSRILTPWLTLETCSMEDMPNKWKPRKIINDSKL